MSSTSSASSTLLQVDDFYFSVLLCSDENEEIFPISEEKYAENLCLQEALMSAVIAASSSTQMAAAAVTNASSMQLKRKAVEFGESSKRFCGICMEGKQQEEMFMNDKCSHTFCSDCTSKHIAAKIQENIMVTCPEPNCKEMLEPHTCQSIVPIEVFDRWGTALCESAIHGYQKFYCPYKDCSAMYVDDGQEVIRNTECLHCRRLFCAQCKVPWHLEISCEEYQRLPKDEREVTDLMVMSLAKEKEWRRCPNCRMYVEKKEGCLHMTCRCRFQFCYRCGATWSSSHGGCA